jgi:steroid 5-alpha reductase family enzyme
MKYSKPLFPFLLGCSLLLSTATLSEIGWISGGIQLLLFCSVVLYPIWKTEKLSYVDIGWPWGLVCIGIVTIIMSDGYGWRVWGVGLLYIFMGARMGLGAIILWRKGYIQQELPRYRYQRMRWERSGKSNTQLAMQIDALVQGLANATYLAFPAFIMGTNQNSSIAMIELVGLGLWIASFVMESIADQQKLSFLRKMKKEQQRNKVCTIGLWKYTRHPNYFAEWMVWNALIIMAIPSWIALQSNESTVLWVLLGLGLLFVSLVMYTSLVHLTGAKPAEYYPLQKRPDYKAYTENVNMFFPGTSKIK